VTYEHSKAGVHIDLEHHSATGGDAQGDIFDPSVYGLLTGSAFADVLTAAQQMDGGAGDDILTAGVSTSGLTGGLGADSFTFKFKVNDGSHAIFIQDFNQSEHDLIDLHLIDATPADGDQAFTFIGTDAFGGKAGELRVEYVNGNTQLEMQMTHNGGTQATIILVGTYTVTAEDFLL
jgi:Ca2+-binding RTX toxin-like protein